VFKENLGMHAKNGHRVSPSCACVEEGPDACEKSNKEPTADIALVQGEVQSCTVLCLPTRKKNDPHPGCSRVRENF
jgi:hypothetical protein